MGINEEANNQIVVLYKNQVAFFDNNLLLSCRKKTKYVVKYKCWFEYTIMRINQRHILEGSLFDNDIYL